MDFAWAPETEDFRGEVQAFLAQFLTPEVEDRLYRTGMSHDDEFARAVGSRGWIAPELVPGDHEPLDAAAFHVLTEEFTRTEAPFYGLSTSEMVIRVIDKVGNDELKAEVIPPVLRGEIIIALGMSEPEAGSDVAAVRTKATRDGDDWVIEGQKMFTTNAHVADYVFLLARTNPDVPKHKGLTTFLVPLNQPGVEVQAVFTLSGERTNITFYNGVRVDDRWRIGEVDGGWGALMLSLQDEHSAPFAPHLRRVLDETEAWATTAPAPGEAAPIQSVDVQERLARAATAMEVADLLERRTTFLEEIGQVPVVEGPMSKLFGTEACVRFAEDLNELVGPDALRSRTDPTAVGGGLIEHGMRFSLGTTIYAGTSEIQRNIIAQRGCGLPR